MSIFQDQAKFMQRGEQNTESRDTTQAAMYADLMREESSEFRETQDPYYVGRPSDDVKEAVDVIVVAAGYLVSLLGADGAQVAWDLVVAANHRKLDGPIIKRGDGKILQTPEYKAKVKADLAAALDVLVAKTFV